MDKKEKLKKLREIANPGSGELLNLIEKVEMVKGEKGDSPTQEELVKIIKPLIPAPIKGDKGDTVIPTRQELEEIIKPLIPAPLKGDKGDPVKPTLVELEAIIKPLIPAPLKGDKGKDAKPLDAQKIKDEIYGELKKKPIAEIGDTKDLVNFLRAGGFRGGGMGNPMTTPGDIIYNNSSSAPARLGIGTTGQVLTVSASGFPVWSNSVGGVSSINGLTGAVVLAAGTGITLSPFGNTITISSTSSGGVTSVSNSDGTLTISPTTGAVVASLALAHANTWTGQQTFSTSAPIFSTMTAGSILFAGTAGLLSQDNSNFFYDATNHRLGLGTTSPAEQLQLTGNLRLTATTTTTGAVYSDTNLLLHTYGTSNTFLGINSGNLVLTSASENTAMGNSALPAVTTGVRNTALGFSALGAVGTGGNNTAVGRNALAGITTVSENTAVGGDTGTNNIGSSNTFLGYAAATNAGGAYTRSTAIGERAIVGASNTMVLGGTGGDSVQVVINGTTAVGQLDVNINSASRIGLIVKGASSQSANLQEWQNSTSVVKAAVSANGAIGIGFGTPGASIASITDLNAGILDIAGNSSGSLGGIAVVRLLPNNGLANTTNSGAYGLFAVNQTFVTSARRGNFELYDFQSGAVRLILDSSGRINVGGGFSQPWTAQFSSWSSDATYIGLQVRGFTSQSANLQTWENVSAGILASMSSVGILTLGLAGTQTGNMKFKGTTSGTVTLGVADAAGTWTMKLPTTAGTNLYVLQTDGSGNTSWVPQSGGGSPAGSDGYIQFNTSSAFDASASLTWLATGSANTMLNLYRNDSNNGAVNGGGDFYGPLYLNNLGTGGVGIVFDRNGGSLAPYYWSLSMDNTDRLNITRGGLLYGTNWETNGRVGFGLNGAAQYTIDVGSDDGNGTINVLGTIGATYRWGQESPTEPTVSNVWTATDYVGNNNYVLTNPAKWVIINIGGDDYVVPAYPFVAP